MKDFPGKRIHSDADAKIERTIRQLNPDKTESAKNIKTWKRVDGNIYHGSFFLSNSALYVIYKHPVHSYLDKLYWAGSADVEKFMKERIDPDQEEGLDIIVFPPNSHDIVICNHDGQIYHAKTAEETIPPPESP